jgi:protein-S-isoprenylcysteine O-methyltransferase Ste14
VNALLLVITGLSIVVSIVASTVALRLLRDERRRSEARVAALSEAIYEEATHRAVDVAPLFQETIPRTRFRYAVIALCAGAALAGLAMVFWSGGSSTPASAATVNRSAHHEAVRRAAPKTTDPPLELVALEHERDGYRLAVRGLVRNPEHAAARNGLIAVVLAYSRSGDLVASGRAAVLSPKLAAGETTPFFVSVSGADNIDRIRVSFRTGSHVEPHVDRRTHTDAKEVD